MQNNRAAADEKHAKTHGTKHVHHAHKAHTEGVATVRPPLATISTSPISLLVGSVATTTTTRPRTRRATCVGVL